MKDSEFINIHDAIVTLIGEDKFLAFEEHIINHWKESESYEKLVSQIVQDTLKKLVLEIEYSKTSTQLNAVIWSGTDDAAVTVKDVSAQIEKRLSELKSWGAKAELENLTSALDFLSAKAKEIV